MSLFKSKAEQTYKSVVDALVALSEQEYKKLIKVVGIRRKSNSDVTNLLGGITLENYPLEYEDIGAQPKIQKAGKKK